MSRLMLAFLLIVACAAPAGAQSTVLRTGDEVRVKSASASGRFTVQDASDDALLLRDSVGTSVSVPLSTVTSLSVSRGPRSVGMGALRGAGFGAGAGALSGIVIGLASGDDDSYDGWFAFTAEEKAAMAGVLLGGAGAALGALIGVAAPGERWEQVPLPYGARAEVGRDGGLLLGYAIRF